MPKALDISDMGVGRETSVCLEDHDGSLDQIDAVEAQVRMAS
jgi:hypothetical protein